ncbi:hypothetical protein J6590_028270 [Homalodisca vitripennis]|nr:hypothetical protein J6590_028270 [Homalodisca vitripennis]
MSPHDEQVRNMMALISVGGASEAEWRALQRLWRAKPFIRQRLWRAKSFMRQRLWRAKPFMRQRLWRAKPFIRRFRLWRASHSSDSVCGGQAIHQKAFVESQAIHQKAFVESQAIHQKAFVESQVIHQTAFVENQAIHQKAVRTFPPQNKRSCSQSTMPV